MKRILGIMICFTLLIQGIAVPCMAEAEKLPTYSTEAEILINLGIAKSFDMQSYDPYSYIPNGEFLSMLNEFMGGSVVSDYEAFAKQLGAIEKNEKLQDFMYPTSDFAMAAALGALGYNKIGVMPENGKRAWALKQASRLGLLSGLPTEEEMSLRRAEAVNLIFNMLEVQVLDLRTVSWDEDGYVTSSFQKTEDEALYFYHKIYRTEGIVDGTEFTEMYGESNVGEGNISIEGKTYGCNADFDKYVGLLCDVYVEKETGRVVSVTPFEDIKSVSINAEEIESYSEDSRTLNYTNKDGNKKYKAAFESTAAVIYNGRGLEAYGKSDIEISNGRLVLYDNNRNGKYDLVRIEEAATFLTESVNMTDRIVYNKLTYDKDNVSITADEREKTNKVSIIKDGMPVTFDDILENDILEVYYNPKATRRIIKIIAVSNSFKGIVGYASSDGKKISVDGKEYRVAESYLSGIEKGEKYTPSVKAGQAYVFYLNSNGEIAAAEADKYDGMICGYLYNTAVNQNAFENTYGIRLYTESEKWENFNLAEKIKLNGVTEETNKCFINIEEQKGELILVKINSDGLVNEVRTATDKFVLGETSENFNKSAIEEGVDSTLTWRNVANYFEGTTSKKHICFIGTHTKIFAAGDDEDDFGMTTTGALNGDAAYTGVTAYGVDEFGIADFVVMKTDEKMRKEKLKAGTSMIVSETYETINSEGEIVKVIVGPYEFLSRYTVIFDADAKEYDISGNEITTPTQIEPGDLVKFNKNSEGAVKSYTVLCRASYADKGEGYFPSIEEQPRGFHTSQAYMYGTLVSSNPEKNVFMLDVKKSASDAQLLKPAVTLAAVKVFICEGNERYRSVSKGSIRDMVRGDFVYAAASYAGVNTIVIYK